MYRHKVTPRLFTFILLCKWIDYSMIFVQLQIKNPSVATYFTNRALCHLKMKRWEATCQDCRRALDIDNNQVKGHFFLGQALVELDCYDEAIKHLHRGEYSLWSLIGSCSEVGFFLCLILYSNVSVGHT